MSGDLDVGAVEQPAEERSAAPAVPDPAPPGLLEHKSPEARRWNDLYNLAQRVAATEIVPKPLRGRPDAVFAVMASADERGIAPLTGLQQIDLIDGRPAPSAMLQRAMIQRAGHLLVWRRFDDTAAVLYGRRRDTGVGCEAIFTIDHARQQKLTGKTNWQINPRAMLMARVTSLLARAMFADVVLGMEYTPEELGAVGTYSAIDMDYDPDTDRHVMIDPDTGEILDADEVDDDTPAHQVQATVLDAEDAMDAEFLRQARDAADEADGRAALWDDTDAEN